MKHSTLHDQRGVSRVGLIVSIILVFIVAVLLWSWLRNDETKREEPTTATRKAIQDAKCDYTDTDLCKFFAVRKATKNYSLTSVRETPANGQKSDVVIKYDGPAKYYMKVTGAEPKEVISINDTLYTKEADGTWAKQTVQKAEAIKSTEVVNLPLPEAVKDADATKVSYKKIGEEKCGTADCLKYQVVNPAAPKAATYIWFSADDYQLRRMQSTAETTRFDTNYDYAATTIAAPSPTRDLASAPAVQGQSTALPKTGDD